jgi:ferric-dicitrate binding protein FerR (iron transport regulator)
MAADKSLFSVTTDSDSRRLTVKTGIVYFALSTLPRTLVFQTPDGVITIHEVILKAASNGGSLKGYVFVEEGITRVGVLEGGAMLMMVDDGRPITIDAGRELRLAQAEIFKEEKEDGKTEESAQEGAAEGTPEEGAAGEAGTAVSTGGVSTTAAVIGGIILVGAGIALAAGGGGSDDGGTGSPAAP